MKIKFKNTILTKQKRPPYKLWKTIINKNVNNTFITLIAKKLCNQKPTDYRLISLTIYLYKVIAKLLAERTKITLPTTIAEDQLAFVKGRQIIDAILMTNEIIDYWKARKTKGFCLNWILRKHLIQSTEISLTSCTWRKITLKSGESGYNLA